MCLLILATVWSSNFSCYIIPSSQVFYKRLQGLDMGDLKWVSSEGCGVCT